jgi:AraC-like DNA-binding protein
VEAALGARAAASVWDIAVPPKPGMPGVTMAGFRARDRSPIDLRVVPFPAVTLVVDLGGGSFVVDDANGRRQRGSLVVGIAPGGLRARGCDIDCLQVRLSPIVAHAVFGGAAAEAGGAMVALDDLWGREAARLEQRLYDAPSSGERFTIVEAALAGRWAAGRTVDGEVDAAWAQMVTARGRLRVDGLAEDLGWSRKRLWARFRSQVGLTPKRAAQLVRFDHAAHLLAAGHGAARVAAESGYADQSHLHREVMAFAGMTPTGVATAAWLAVDPVAWVGASLR